MQQSWCLVPETPRVVDEVDEPLEAGRLHIVDPNLIIMVMKVVKMKKVIMTKEVIKKTLDKDDNHYEQGHEDG